MQRTGHRTQDKALLPAGPDKVGVLGGDGCK